MLLVAVGRGERALSLLSELARSAAEEDENGRSSFWDLYRPLAKALPHLCVGPEALAQNAASILKASSGDLNGRAVVWDRREDGPAVFRAGQWALRHPDFSLGSSRKIPCGKCSRSLPQLKEFRPPSRRKYILRRALQDQQVSIMEQAREQSDIMSLFARHPLKYGRAFFSKRGPEGFSEPSRLSSFSHSTEMPREANIDPVGMEYRRFRWRQAGLLGVELESETQTEDGGAE